MLFRSTVFNETVAQMGKRLCLVANRPEADEATAPCLDAVDIAGYNYASCRYPNEGEVHPNRIIVGSETMPYDIVANWEMVEKYPYVIGDFMWAAWDYLGEVGIGSWSYEKECYSSYTKSYPGILAETGAFDILGDDTAEAGLAAVTFGARKTPYIGVKPVNHPGQIPAQAIWRGTNAIPSWSWQGCEGNLAEVEVYSDAEVVELFLNEQSLGKQNTDQNLATFEVTYASGTLKAVAYKEGQVVGESELHSAQGQKQLAITAETAVKVDEILYVAIRICGENGVVEANADIPLTVAVEGGKLLGFGSACPRTEDAYVTGTFSTHYGKSLAVIQPERDSLTVTVTSEAYGKVSTTIS